MKKVMLIKVTIIVFVLAVLVFATNSFCNRYPKYILLKKGISTSEIVLSLDREPYFKIYLYKTGDNDKENLGLVTLFKASSDSKKWSVRSNSTETYDGNEALLSTYYSKVNTGSTDVITVVGGCTPSKPGKNITIFVNGVSYNPTRKIENLNGTDYFLHDCETFVDNQEQIKVGKN